MKRYNPNIKYEITGIGEFEEAVMTEEDSGEYITHRDHLDVLADIERLITNNTDCCPDCGAPVNETFAGRFIKHEVDCHFAVLSNN